MPISKSIDHNKDLTCDISYLTCNDAKNKLKVDLLDQSKNLWNDA